MERPLHVYHIRVFFSMLCQSWPHRSIGHVSLDVADPNAANRLRAPAVESCECLPGYTGTSCEVGRWNASCYQLRGWNVFIVLPKVTVPSPSMCAVMCSRILPAGRNTVWGLLSGVWVEHWTQLGVPHPWSLLGELHIPFFTVCLWTTLLQKSWWIWVQFAGHVGGVTSDK